MKLSMTLVAATALIGLAATLPARGDDCETVVDSLNEAVSIGNKNFETMMGELKKIMSQGSDDKARATVKNRFCSASGELLGTFKAVRAVAGECGAAQKAALGSLDASIKETETAIDNTCK
jgi:hypothetical protein